MKPITSIKKVIAFNYVLAGYNKRRKTELRPLDISALFVLMDGGKYKRLAIIDRLKTFRRTCTYTLLNKRLKYLTEEKLVVLELNQHRAKKYSISINGKFLLWEIETKIRAFRADKLKY